MRALAQITGAIAEFAAPGVDAGALRGEARVVAVGPQGGLGEEGRPLGLGEGDDVVFRVEGDRAVLARTPEFLSLAGTVAVPAAKRSVAWDEVIRSTRAKRAATAR